MNRFVRRDWAGDRSAAVKTGGKRRMLVFGSQYLRAWTPRMEDWDRDLAAMKALGFNTVRAWLVWNVLELSEGVYNWAYLDTFADLVAKHGLRVGYLFHLHGAPEWLIKRYPHYFYVDTHGKPYEPSARPNTPSGGWPGLCYDHPEVRAHEERFISAVVRHLAGRSEIAFWEPMNEPHVIIDFASPEDTPFCYCCATRSKFRLWLERKYGTIGRLNAAWGRHHNEWDEVRPVTGQCGYRDVVDFRMFMAENLVEEVAWRTEVIRRNDSRPVIAHCWGGGSAACAQLGGMSCDDWRNSRCFDMWGLSAFPSTAGLSLLGFSTDAARSAADGKTFWQAELGAGDHSGGFGRRGRVRPEELALWTWESIRHGAKGVLYWQYRPEAHGHEMGGYGLTDYAGGATDRLLAVAAIGRLLNQYGDYFASAAPAAAEVAIVFSLQSYLVDWCEHRHCRFSIDCASGYYRMLWERNVAVDIVHEEFIDAGKLKPYKLVIAPQPSALHANAKAALEQYVRAGGCLLSDPFFAAFDDSLKLDAIVPGSGFASVFGCEEDDVRNEPDTEIVYRDRKLRLTGGKLKETFRHVAAETVAVYADGSGPALLKHRYGEGNAYMSGVHLGLTYAHRGSLGDELTRETSGPAANADAAASLIVMELVRELGIVPAIDSGSPHIQGGLLTNEGKEDVLILLNSSDAGREAAVRIRSKPYGRAYDIIGDQAADIAENTLQASLAPWQAQVYLLG
ncbi:MAG: beta-galactosidase [Paenibacillaceae bacterium]|nr:beta-galactosidase [Paenibacillaceae bacterium]